MWEYRIEQIDLPSARFGDFTKLKGPEQAEYQLLAQLGQYGWELVSAVPIQTVTSARQMRLYFKRFRQVQPA